MYLKKVVSKNITYLKLVESIWDKQNKKRKQKTVLNLGRLDTLMENGLPFVVQKLSSLVNAEIERKYQDKLGSFPELKDVNSISHQCNACYGHIAYKKLWDAYDFDKYFALLNKRTKNSFEFPELVYLMVVNQLLQPSSKLKLWNNVSTYFGVKGAELQHLYRSLDVLSESKEEIEDYIFQKNKNLFNLKLDVVFYDVTTFYFESQKQDELKDFGFDKDNKINNVHIVMGLLIDQTGKPIGYELFKGNTYEGHTLLKTLEKLKQRFDIDTVIIVADKGLNLKMNLKEIRDAGYHYIVSGRLKSMSRKTKELVLDHQEYEQIEKPELAITRKLSDQDSFKYKTIEYQNIIRYKENPNDKHYKKVSLQETLVCTYSSKRANKDKKDRERMLEKAQLIIQNNDKSKLGFHKGHKKYVKKNYPDQVDQDNYVLSLNQEKVQDDEKYDGYYVIQSSKPDLAPKQVIEQYHYLYKIEESFRIMKSTMQVRPVNHWTPRRIKGHFVMSFIAFLLERELELRMINNKKTNAPEQIKEAINSMKFSKLSIDHQDYYLRNNHKRLASEILAVLRIKQPENLLNTEQVDNYMSKYFKT